MIKIWKISLQQIMITQMAYITGIMQELQKKFQSTNLILPDVITNALRKLQINKMNRIQDAKKKVCMN